MTNFLYSVPGTYTWTCPPNCTSIYTIVIGGGGGGAGRAGPSYLKYPTFNDSTLKAYHFSCGGGAGGLGIGVYSVTPYTNYIITVGAGGQGAGRNNPLYYVNGNGTSDGSNGKSSSFSSYITSTGGYGGVLLTNTSYYNGSSGGTSVGATIYKCDGGYGGGFKFTPTQNVTSVECYATGGGGLCGANGGDILKTINDPFFGTISSNVSGTNNVSGGGGMYKGGTAPFPRYNFGTGINKSVNQKFVATGVVTSGACSLFGNLYPTRTDSFDLNSLSTGTPDATTNRSMGGIGNRPYKSPVIPPHLITLAKLFNFAGGNYSSNSTAPILTGGANYISSGQRLISTLLTGGTAGNSSNHTYTDTIRTAFGCGGGGSITNVTGSEARPDQNGVSGGNGLVYIEW